MVAVLLWSSLAGLAQTNSWNSTNSGHWEDLTWSLGIRPAADQSVFIIDAVSKAIGIYPTTPGNFPGTMTVSNLSVFGPPGSRNTLLLNFFGTAVPLRVLNDCTISTNGSLLSLNSGLQVGRNLMITSNATFVQQGGVTIATNGEFTIQGGRMALTNATVQLSSQAYVAYVWEVWSNPAGA